MVDSVTVTPLPPVPTTMPPLMDANNGRTSPLNFIFNVPWTQWFVQVKAKIDTINSILVSISSTSGNGLVVVDGANGTSVSRTITGTSGEIAVSNGDGVSGNPTISLVSTGITPGTYQGLTLDADGRVTAVNISYTVATLPGVALAARAFVTDATLGLAAGIGTVVVGGGANNVPVYSDGVNWLIG